MLIFEVVFSRICFRGNSYSRFSHNPARMSSAIIDLKAIQTISDTLGQGCTTYGPRVKCGPRRILIWPPKSIILFVMLVSLIKTHFKCIKTYQIWPLVMPKNFFWPAMIFELCTPALGGQQSVTWTIISFLSSDLDVFKCKSHIWFERAWLGLKDTSFRIPFLVKS